MAIPRLGPCCGDNKNGITEITWDVDFDQWGGGSSRFEIDESYKVTQIFSSIRLGIWDFTFEQLSPHEFIANGPYPNTFAFQLIWLSAGGILYKLSSGNEWFTSEELPPVPLQPQQIHYTARQWDGNVYLLGSWKSRCDCDSDNRVPGIARFELVIGDSHLSDGAPRFVTVRISGRYRTPQPTVNPFRF